MASTGAAQVLPETPTFRPFFLVIFGGGRQQVPSPPVESAKKGVKRQLQSKIGLLLAAALLTVMAATNCSTLVYSDPQHQGNYLGEDVLADLKVGMSKNQVIALLGNPLLTSPFDSRIWDYVSYREGRRGQQELLKVRLYFNSRQRLYRIDREGFDEGQPPLSG